MRTNNIITILGCLLIFKTQALQAQNIPTGATAPQLSMPSVPAAYSGDVPVNYVRTWEPRKAVTDTTTT